MNSSTSTLYHNPTPWNPLIPLLLPGHTLKTVIDNFPDSGNKAGYYSDALARVPTQQLQYLHERFEGKRPSPQLYRRF